MRTTISKVIVSAIKSSLKSDKIMEAELRQTITRHYDGVQTSNSLEDALFTPEELGVAGASYEEKRVAWKEVPADATVDGIQAMLDAKMPAAKLVRYLSNKVILNDTQENTIKNGLTGEKFENFKVQNGLDPAKTVWDDDCRKALYNRIVEAQTVKYGESNKEGKPADEAVLFNGERQYKRIVFSATEKPDYDFRSSQTSPAMSIDLAPAQEEAVKA